MTAEQELFDMSEINSLVKKSDYACTRLLMDSIYTPEEVNKGVVLSDELISAISYEVVNKINELTENKRISCESIDKIVEKISDELYSIRIDKLNI